MTTKQKSVYRVVPTNSGWAVEREDGQIAEFAGLHDKDDALRAKQLLDQGFEDESDYVWRAV